MKTQILSLLYILLLAGWRSFSPSALELGIFGQDSGIMELSLRCRAVGGAAAQSKRLSFAGKGVLLTVVSRRSPWKRFSTPQTDVLSTMPCFYGVLYVPAPLVIRISYLWSANDTGRLSSVDGWLWVKSKPQNVSKKIVLGCNCRWVSFKLKQHYWVVLLSIYSPCPSWSICVCLLPLEQPQGTFCFT